MYKWIYESEPDKNGTLNIAGGICVLGLFVSIVIAIFGIYGVIRYLVVEAWLPYWLSINFHIIFLAALVLIWLTDLVAHYIMEYIDEGESSSRFLIVKHIASKYWYNEDKPLDIDSNHPYTALFIPNMALSGLFTLGWTVVTVFPVVWYIIGAFSLVYAILRLARFARRTQKKFNKHVVDPNAHTEQENMNDK